MNHIFPYFSGSKSGRSKFSIESDYLLVKSREILFLCQSPYPSKKSIGEMYCEINGYQCRYQGYTYGQTQGFNDNIHYATKRRYNPNGKHFVIEHSIPRDVMTEYIRENCRDEHETLDYILKANHPFIVTKEEDKLLSNGKLKSRMPQGANPWDVTARYNAVGIKIVKPWSN